MEKGQESLIPPPPVNLSASRPHTKMLDWILTEPDTLSVMGLERQLGTQSSSQQSAKCLHHGEELIKSRYILALYVMETYF
jgi:hypothetical protein